MHSFRIPMLALCPLKFLCTDATGGIEKGTCSRMRHVFAYEDSQGTWSRMRIHCTLRLTSLALT